MATINIKVDDKQYTLGFSKKTIMQMSDNGFTIEKAKDDYVAGIPQLFAGAFLRWHRTISDKEIDDIWKMIPDKAGFIGALVDLYNEQLSELFGEPDDEAKKAVWEVVK